MVDIQYAAAEIRRGKKKDRKKKEKPQGKNIMSASATQGGHNYTSRCCFYFLTGNAHILILRK